VTVPDLAGLDETAAQELLATTGLGEGRVVRRANRQVPAGLVIRTAPAAGTQVAPGAQVRVIISSGPPASPSPSFEPMPSVTPSAAPSDLPSPSGAPSPAPSASAIAGDHLAAVQAAGVLRVLVSPDDPPWSRVAASGEAVGFEVGLARRIARQLGVDVAFTTDPVPGPWDVALRRLLLTDASALEATFSRPYAWDPLGVAVTDGSSTAPEDLIGLAVCVTDGSVAQAWLEGRVTLVGPDGLPALPPPVTTVPVATAEECLTTLDAGAADAWVDSRSALGAATDAGLAVGGDVLALVPIAVAVEPAGSLDRSLVDAVDAAIVATRDDGQLERLSIRFFDTDLTVDPAVAVPGAEASPSPAAATTREGRG